MSEEQQPSLHELNQQAWKQDAERRAREEKARAAATQAVAKAMGEPTMTQEDAAAVLAPRAGQSKRARKPLRAPPKAV